MAKPEPKTNPQLAALFLSILVSLFLYFACRFNVLDAIVLIGTSGALGGLAFALASDKSHTLSIPFKGDGINTGFIGDMFIGFTSAIVGVVLIGTIFGKSNISVHEVNISPEQSIQLPVESKGIIDLTKIDKTNKSNVLAIIAISILCGFYGLKLLTGLSDKLFKDLEKKVDKVSEQEKLNEKINKANHLIQEGNRHVDRKEFRQAIRFFEESSELNPSVTAFGKLAFCKAELNDFEGALGNINNALDLEDMPEGSKEAIHWNRACYLSMLNRDLTTIINDVSIAVKLGSTTEDIEGESHLNWAKTQAEFKKKFLNS